ncbi:putative hydrolase of HD superfamily [Kribbella antiqua]|uniref:5'-deoxynucleotidase n=1 Tax=Kribbella antiqua TaxID=2512217 RepID=A0A4R2IC40_9ACTN|nr:HD domain-containing protein [Kribbella antiqua]TCO41038.1 putative hydrolase of HD superfamily [Kribbella antiqua]
MSNVDGLADFLYEVGQLKRTWRTGWSLARMSNRESVADHSFRAAVIAMILAELEGADADRAAAIALIHDLPEARLGDMNHLTRRYLAEEKPFRQVVDDQTDRLTARVRDLIQRRAEQWVSDSSAEADVARDADVIESILHVRESLPGRPDLVARWHTYLSRSIRTASAKKLIDAIAKSDPDDWWPRAVTDE